MDQVAEITDWNSAISKAKPVITDKTYESERAELSIAYVEDAAGFYYEDYRLRMKYGLPIFRDHEQAVIAKSNELMGSKDWREEEKPF